MKELKIKNIKIILICLLTVLMIFSTVAFVGIEKRTAKANGTTFANTELFLPKTEVEYKELTSPIDAYSDDTVTAIVENSQSYHVLSVFTANGYFDTSTTSNLGNLTGVHKLDDEYLLYANAGDLYRLSLADFSSTEIEFDDKKGISTFDVAGDYLVTALNTEMALYKFENGYVARSLIPKTIKDKSPVAINENGEVFFVKNNGVLSKFSVSDPIESTPIELAMVTPTQMIANNDYIYYLYGNNVYKLSVNGGELQKLIVADDDNYDLGKLDTPSGISFKGNNLLITDTALNAVQEFKIDNDKLIFTGFAIAKNKTAFNRIDKYATEIEKFNDTVAVLDGDSLLVINNDESFNPYNPNCFKDYSDIKLQDKMPTTFALGSSTALLAYDSDLSSSKLNLFNVSDGTFISQNAVKIFDGNIIRDVCYQSGKYYVLTGNGTACKVYSCSESELSFNEYTPEDVIVSTQITVDVFGNVYLLKENSKIYKYTVGSFDSPTEYDFSNPVTKMATDLSGTLFVLSENKVFALDQTKTSDYWTEIDINSTGIEQNANIKSFTMDYVSQDVFFIYDDEEFICKASALGNISISSLEIPTEYVTTDSTTTFDKLKIYAPTESANVYSVNKTDDGFEYLSLVNERTEYALITQVVKADIFGRELKMLALAGQDGVVLINENQCQIKVLNTTTAPEKAFITTAVHMYYLPISTPTDEYSLSNTNKIRLNKYSEITPQIKFTFLNKDYYFASVMVNGVTLSGYVPVDFTVEILSEDLAWDSFTIEKVNKTTVYSDKALTSQIKTLERGTEIRLIERDGSTCKIAYKVDQTNWAIGYIDASAIQDPANVATRNILIILAVTACLCGTISYFLLRRKK